MADDLISRQAALDALGERPMLWTDDDYYVLGGRNQYDSDRLAIETVPSAQRWIPVTKRLPENDDECLTILEDGLYYVQAYSDGEWYYDDVVAWMPLPETYKEHDDD